MDNLIEVFKIDFYHNNAFWGFRKWTLVAYNNNNEIICSVDKSESNNYLKYVRFIQELKKLGYKLTESQKDRFKSGEKNFMNKSLLCKATKNHLY